MPSSAHALNDIGPVTRCGRPEQYGVGLVDLVGRILRGERVPPAVYIEHHLVDASNIDVLHPEP
ncbi:MAG: hypothetical protein IPM16_18450 [Chloroflexi bacterium]|nr:hypothetical protein [Chloroflexota bacterium]